MGEALVYVVSCGVLCLSCHTTYREVYPSLLDGRYDSEFPYRDCSKQLEEIASAVKMISCVAYYHSYLFPREAEVTLEKLKNNSVTRYATKEIFLHRSSSGTATIIVASPSTVLLLSCAHVVMFSDTIISYYYNDANQPTPYVRTISFKERQSNYAAGIAGSRELEILAEDSQRDVAFLGAKIQSEFPPRVLRYPLGNARELEWGSFVYVFGYPAGQCVVTKAIVSSPNKDKYGSFLIDAVVNRGFSGGLVLAVRDGVPNFEVVGMVRLVAAKAEYYLSPTREGMTIDYDPDVPYQGEMYVDRRLSIEYGLTQVISSEAILEVLQASREKLAARGYDVSSFFLKRSAQREGSTPGDSTTQHSQ